MQRKQGCTVQLIYEDANSKRFISSLIADRGECDPVLNPSGCSVPGGGGWVF